MNITLKGLQMALEVKKVDTPTGSAWRIEMPDGREILIKFYHGKWDTAYDVSNHLLEEIGHEINQSAEARQPEKLNNSMREANQRPKRTRILKYVLI